jgi:hypothetical protein
LVEKDCGEVRLTKAGRQKRQRSDISVLPRERTTKT